MSRQTVLVTISAGWGVRNFIRSGVIRELQEDYRVVVLLPDGDPSLEAELTECGIETEYYGSISIPWWLAKLHTLLVYAHNRRLDLWLPEMWRWFLSTEPWWKRPLHELTRLASRVASFGPIYRRLRKVHERLVRALPERCAVGELFDRVRPSAVLVDNPFKLRSTPVAVEARARGAPAVATIPSWDNLTYKGFPVTRYDGYFVWSELMKDELLETDPQLSPHRVFVTGTPQFDFHLREDLRWSRTEFMDRLGGDPDRPLITYSATADIAFPEEPAVIEMLWEACKAGEVPGDPQLLLRPHPHDRADRFGELRDRHPDILFAEPWTRDDDRFWWFNPELEDLAYLSNVLRHSAVVVNAFSTMLLDAAILDTPSVCVAFSDSPGSPSTEYLRRSPRFGHCRYVTESCGVRIAYDREALVQEVAAYLRDPERDRGRRRRMVARICGPVDGRAGTRIVDVMRSLTDDCSLHRPAPRELHGRM